jgi:hypothetical protein
VREGDLRHGIDGVRGVSSLLPESSPEIVLSLPDAPNFVVRSLFDTSSNAP